MDESAAIDLPSFDDLVAAHGRLQERVRRTPVMTSRDFDARVDRQVFFKCENLQKVGAFKFRGAMNALLLLEQQARQRRIVSESDAFQSLTKSTE